MINIKTTFFVLINPDIEQQVRKKIIRTPQGTALLSNEQIHIV